MQQGLKQYEKFSTFLRNELVSNNLADFRLKKGLDHLDAVRERFQTITARFAGFPGAMAQRPRRLSAAAAPRPADHHWRGPLSRDQESTTRASSACSKCCSMAAATSAAGRPSRSTHAVLTTFHLSDNAYGLNQLRYDLRKLKGHGLLQRDGSRYAYHLTPKGVQVALLFLFFHKRLCGRSPTAASTTAPIPITSQPASSKPPTTAPTTPFNRSSICSPPDLSVAIVELFLSTILGARI